MDSHKGERMNNLIKEGLGEILQNEVEIGEGIFVSIGSAEVTPDLSLAKIWINVWPLEKSNEVLEILKKNNFRLRQELAGKMDLRRVPRLFFQIDTEEIEDEKQRRVVDDILDKIRKEEG
ncbi:ribosome-binding factor A [Candidatus Kuenenbacteria bacterium]|nr:ribosome-binding factor A [Candidatus Kuenenbacteria bacterium]